MEMDDRESAIVGAIHALLKHNQHFGPALGAALDKFEKTFELGEYAPKDVPTGNASE